MNDKPKGPYDFRAPEVESHPLLLINDQATSAAFLAEISDIVGETDAQLVTIGAALDSNSGAPEPQVIVTALWAIQRQFALLRRYLAALQTPTAP